MYPVSSSTRRARWKTPLAFAIIYFVWGSTFLAIRIGVHEFPPFLMAALRFLVAGGVLYAWSLARGERSPSMAQWITISWLSILFFVFDYGLVFWAEQRVPSGVAAVMMATIPLFIALAEITILRTQQLTLRLGLALSAGIVGVAVLMSRSLYLGGEAVNVPGAMALIVASLSWASATVLSRRIALPFSKTMNSGAQMLAGGVFLWATSAALGEFRSFHPLNISREAWLALGYLIVAGSILAFTAYLWLLQHHSATKVGTYAYVNPVVAVLLGYLLAGEPLSARSVLGTLLVMVSVVLITTQRAKPDTSVAAERAAKALG